MTRLGGPSVTRLGSPVTRLGSPQAVAAALSALVALAAAAAAAAAAARAAAAAVEVEASAVMVGRRRRAITATCDLEHFRTASRAANGRSRNAVCPSPEVLVPGGVFLRPRPPAVATREAARDARPRTHERGPGSRGRSQNNNIEHIRNKHRKVHDSAARKPSRPPTPPHISDTICTSRRSLAYSLLHLPTYVAPIKPFPQIYRLP